MRPGLFKRLLIFNVFTSALCIFTHLLLNTALSYIFQNTVFTYSLFTGLYLMSMGLGVLIVQTVELGERRVVSVLLINAVLILLLSNPGAPALFYLNEMLYYLLRSQGIDALFLLLPMGVVLTVLCGIISGAELPLFSRLLEEQASDESSVPLTGVLATDYLGGFVGTLSFSLVLFPMIGLVRSIVFAQAVLLVALNYMFFYVGWGRSWKRISMLVILNLYVAVSLFFQKSFLETLDAISYW